MFKLALAIPSGHTWEADFALSIVQLTMVMGRIQVPGYKGQMLQVINKRTSLLPKSRSELLDDALKCGCSHLLFVDSDQTFPGDLVHRMIKHKKPVIGCNIATKSVPSGPTARQYSKDWPGGDQVYSNGKSGIEKVWRLGCGIMLIDLSVLKEVPKPWFGVEWNKEMNEFVGEDWFFCQQLEKAGVEIWVDHDVSLEVGHVGSFTFTHDYVGLPE